MNRPSIDATLGGSDAMMPRFWVLTDHDRREVVLVLRGTMSLNELAVDLTCESADFHLHSLSSNPGDEDDELDAFDQELDGMPGSFPIDMSTPPPVRTLRRTRSILSTSSEDDETYPVHGGMLKMARAMGCRGKPVHVAVRRALRRNDGYSEFCIVVCPAVKHIQCYCPSDLIICGHSLGAGVAALLALVGIFVFYN